MLMKKILKLFSLIAIIASLLILCITAISAENEPFYTESGVLYRISDDGTYVIITGYDQEFANLTIESEILGLPVKEIATSAFHNNIYVTNVIIPDTVEIIGENAFRNCKNLITVKLPKDLKALPFECFRDCSILSTVKLPEKLEYIDDFCFQGCTLLGNMKIPASVTHIGYDAFMYCESIRLDVSENEYAAEYAAINNVNTEFKGTSAYFFLMMGAGILVAAAIAVAIYFIGKKHFEKHPSHNPFIYIGKFFIIIFKPVKFLIMLIKKLLNAIIDLIISAIIIIKNRLKKKQ